MHIDQIIFSKFQGKYEKIKIKYIYLFIYICNRTFTCTLFSRLGIRDRRFL